MDRNGKLRLELVDVYGNRLAEKVDIHLHHQTLTDNRIVRNVSAASKIKIVDLHGFPQGRYRIEIDPPSYLPVSQFVNLKAEDVTDVRITCPIDPKKVAGVVFPSYQDLPEAVQTLLENSDQVFSFEGTKGKELYDALDDIRRAGFLNIVAKAQATLLGNGKTVLPHIRKLNELRGDRFFAVVPKELREETKNSVAAGLFHAVSGLLHHLPAQFSHFVGAGSFKTEDRYGNLQLSFFMSGDECVADLDIDDAAGLEHVFQVLRNTLTGRPTHPYDIHEILVSYQKLDLGYQFVV
jgi:hypothetical protein